MAQHLIHGRLPLPNLKPPGEAGAPSSSSEPSSSASSSRPIEFSDFELKPFMARSDRMAIWQLANTLIPYGLLWWLAAWCQTHAPLLLPPVIGLMVLFLARCFSLMHDCGHGSLFRQGRANRLAGFLFGSVCGLPQLPWSRGHAFHHRHNGNWELYKGPSALISTAAYQELSPSRQRLYRWLRHPLMLVPGGFFYLVVKPRLALLLGLLGLVPHAVACLQSTPQMTIREVLASYRSRHWYSPEEGLDLALNNLAVLSLWLAMGLAMGAGPFWLIYAPVMGFGAAIFICIFFVQHNFPGSYAHRSEGWSALRGHLEGTSDIELPAVLNWFSADIGCHAIHHLCSAIPNYQLRPCQNRNAKLLKGVTRLSLADLPGCFDYILWDPERSRLTTTAAATTTTTAASAAAG